MEVSGRRTVYRGSSACTPLCDPCQAVHDDVNACSYCLDCNDYLCTKCTKLHGVSKLSLGHKILNQNEMPKKWLLYINICAKHGEMFKHYCQSHGEICCSCCVTAIHDKCQIKLLKAVASDFGNSSEYKLLRENLERFSEELDQLQKSLDEAISSSKENYSQVISDIQSFRTQINDRLDILEKDIKESIEKEKSYSEAKLNSLCTGCINIQGELDKLNMCLDELELYKHHELLFISAMNTETSLKTYQENMETMSQEADQMCEDRYHFSVNEELLEFMKSIHTFGNVERKADEASKKSPTSFRLEEHINIKCPKDADDCWITGCVDLGDGYMAIADHNNSCIKLLDLEKGSVIDHVKIPVKPWDIARASGRRLVVSGDDRLVYLKVRCRPVLGAGSEVNIDGSYSGVIYSNGNLVVSKLDHVPAILVMSKDGDVKKKRFLKTDISMKCLHRRFMSRPGPIHKIYL